MNILSQFYKSVMPFGYKNAFILLVKRFVLLVRFSFEKKA